MNNIRIAIQSKGKLAQPSIDFLKSLGLEFDLANRSCLVKCKNAPAEILFIRDDDIPQYVEKGIADLGIVGENILYENNAQLQVVKKLGFGRCNLVIAVPNKSKISDISQLCDKNIATSFPNLLKNFLKRENISANVIKLKGAVEIAPRVNLSDAICDLCETGKTLKENKLRQLDNILCSEAILVKSPFINRPNNKILNQLLN
ncbi:MAG: ATP phosphoribosyltransferase [Patescibacteria group bacterium]